MKITKLRIKGFGKFKELEVKFGPKLNVVYGVNEAGKSTVLGFIKAMFYGMNSRKRELRENDRLRFQPWNGDFGEGELSFQDETGREFLMRRKFGNERRDNIYVSDVGTGRRAANYEGTNLGETILGLGEAAFTRTIYVPQLGCAVSTDKEDEIMARLMNLQQTGEEQVSLQKAMTILEKERKKISLRSGNGKLDNLLALQLDLRQEREVVQKLHQENITDQLELNELKEKKDKLQQIITRLEEKKADLKKRKQYLEYTELKKAAEALQSLREEARKIENGLLCGDSVVDAQFLQEVQQKITEWQQQAKSVQELEEEISTKGKALEQVEARLAKFQGFAGLEDNIGAQVLLKEQEEKSLTEKLAKLEKHQQEKAELEAQLEAKKAGLGSLAAFYELTPAEEEEITKKEAEKRQYEDKLKQDQQIDSLRREFISDKLKRAQNRFAFSLVAVVAGLISGLIFHPLSYLFALFGLISGIFEFFQVKKHKVTMAEIEAQLTANGNSESLKKMYEAVNAELSTFYQRYGVSDHQQFNVMRRKFESIQSEIGIFEATIFDRIEQLAGENAEAVRRQLKECQDYLQSLFAATGSNCVQEFNAKLSSFLEHKHEQEHKKRELQNLHNKRGNLQIQREELAKTVDKQLKLEDAGSAVMVQAEQLLLQYNRNLTRKSEVGIRIEAAQKNLEERLAGRSLTELAASVEGYRAEWGKTEELAVAQAETEENLELRLKELHEERLEAEKRFTGIESRIASRFQDVREISRIEEELELVAQQVKEYEEILEALELTKSVLLEAFEELQNSFGPMLNHQVGHILKGISHGKYHDVNVAENYRISLKEQTEWERELGYFSNGTLDQVYFALRLGIIDLAYDSGRKLPLILDDTFVQYDDERLTAVLDYLLAYAEQHQVLLFTCHRREAEILHGKEFTYLTLET